MKLDYKKELEAAARSMILVHEPETLNRLIVRMIVQKVGVNHAGILLRDKETGSYILTVSRGKSGIKIPKGFARMDSDNSLIRLSREQPEVGIFQDGALELEKVKKKLKDTMLKEGIRQLLKGALYHMEMFESAVCIPSYFRDELLGVLLLGKKKDGKKFAQDELDFFVALSYDVAMAIRNAQLFQELEEELDKKHRLFIHTTVALAAAIDAKDHYTHGHTSRVTFLSLEIAKRLSQKDKSVFNEKFLEHLHIAGLLHDIGKIGIPERILNKEGPLNEEERKRMQEHAVVGEIILKPIKELEDAILGVKYHHERYDGSGYPEGLKKDKIPTIAAIIAVADAFDAMTTDRPYRKGLSKDEAIQEIERLKGKQFDPKIADALVGLHHENKI
jgi:HD-GYP domain-containing protein (c-di-GMP phosphodiesterase class II)